MAKEIWKYKIGLTDRQSVIMQSGPKILFVGVQGESIYLWAEVDPETTKQPRLISVYGTGHAMPDNPGRYIGTFMLDFGRFVFHVYDAGSETMIPA